MYTIQDFKVGQRIQLHPGTNLWMQGARYGEIVKVGRKVLHVRLDVTFGKTVRVAPRNVLEKGAK